jgi:hypothetical protein
MNYRIELRKSVVKFLSSCEKRIAVDFAQKAQIIARDPYHAYHQVDCKPMK